MYFLFTGSLHTDKCSTALLNTLRLSEQLKHLQDRSNTVRVTAARHLYFNRAETRSDLFSTYCIFSFLLHNENFSAVAFFFLPENKGAAVLMSFSQGHTDTHRSSYVSTVPLNHTRRRCKHPIVSLCRRLHGYRHIPLSGFSRRQMLQCRALFSCNLSCRAIDAEALSSKSKSTETPPSRFPLIGT